MTRRWLLLLIPALLLRAQTTPVPDTNRQLYLRAVAAGSVRSDVDTWLASLPRHDGLFIVEGDLLFTEQQARGFIAAQKILNNTDTSKMPPKELLLNRRPDGLPDYYREAADRKLTYAVDRHSFLNANGYGKVASHFGEAANEWSAICPECGIEFEHVAAADEQAAASTNFVVRYDPSLPSGYIALAFFPSDPSQRRVLRVGPAYLSNTYFDSTGVFRHEIGHVLGYRHEHIRNSGCGVEDGNWTAITPYDSHSVMHYPCGGGGGPSLAFSDDDKSGHRAVYGSRQEPNGRPAAMAVNFEGGRVASNIFETLRILDKSNTLPTTEYSLKPGENPDAVYRKLLDAPQGFSRSLGKLFAELNPGLDGTRLQTGQKIVVPALKLQPYVFTITYSADSESQQERQKDHATNWKPFLKGSEVVEDAFGANRFTGYKLIVAGDENQLKQVSQQIAGALNSKNVMVTPPATGGSSHFSGTIEGHPRTLLKRFNGGRGPFDAEADLLSILMRLDQPRPTPCGGRPVDVLLLDGPIDGHPDIGKALQNLSAAPRALPEPHGQKEILLRDSLPSDHPTHLAGLIAAQPNGYGIIGIAPCGSLWSFDWDQARQSRDAGVAEDMVAGIRDFVASGGLQIGVLATGWEDAGRRTVLSGLIQRETFRLWVVAAGNQPLKGDEIWTGYPNAPMNLGNLENVVSVTACLECDVDARISNTANPRVAPWASVTAEGQSMVQVAAPGEPILSTSFGAEYTLMYGTSQAAGLVAGLAAAMAQRFPYYSNAARVKYWLQLTALPFGNPESGDDLKVSAGIVNPELALKDPQKPYFETLAGGWQEARDVRWCQPNIILRDPALHSVWDSAAVDQLVRLVYSPRYQTWSFFRLAEPRPDRLPKLAKGTNGYLADQKLVRIDGVVYGSRNLRDVILPKPAPFGACQEPAGGTQ